MPTRWETGRSTRASHHTSHSCSYGDQEVILISLQPILTSCNPVPLWEKTDGFSTNFPQGSCGHPSTFLPFALSGAGTLTLWRRLSLAVGGMGCERPHLGSTVPTVQPHGNLMGRQANDMVRIGNWGQTVIRTGPLTHTRNISRQTRGLWHTTSRNHIKTYTHPLPIIPFPSIIQLHYSNISDPSRPARLSLLRQPPESIRIPTVYQGLFLPPLRLQVLRSVQHPPHSH
jgi:hypothetical protein